MAQVNCTVSWYGLEDKEVLSPDAMDGMDRCTQRPCGRTWSGRGNPCYVRMISPLPPGGNPTTAVGCARCSRCRRSSRSSSASTAAREEFQVIAFARVCQSVELFCIPPKEHTHTPHTAQAAERAETRRCICMCRGGKIEHRSASLTSYVCLPLPLTCRPFEYFVLLFV